MKKENNTIQKYIIGQRVKVTGWTRSANGVIIDIEWVFHHRIGEYTWGYKVLFDNDDNPLTMVYTPEGYLSEEEK